MAINNNLTRFLEAQEQDYMVALNEIKRGKKTGHWMWYIFPQMKGLGVSETARFYAIIDQNEAIAYLNHDVLGSRLIGISSELLKLHSNNPIEILCEVDSMKLRSSMTLFSLLENTNPVFQKVLDKFFDGIKDENTIGLLKSGL